MKTKGLHAGAVGGIQHHDTILSRMLGTLGTLLWILEKS